MSIVLPALIVHQQQLLRGLSYWKVKLRSGREFAESDHSFDLVRGTRPIDWALDVVGSGDNKNITELSLETPIGEAFLGITEPYTAFQLKVGMLPLLGGDRTMLAQIIGRLDDRETGRCTVHIWDVQQQRLYGEWQTYANNFASWRDGIVPLGALSYEIVGLR